MNAGYYINPKDDFNEALNIFEQDYSYEELIELLKNGTIAQKQTAALKLDTVKSEKDAQILVSNLTGQNGKVREDTAFRLRDLMPRTDLLPFFQNKENYKIFLDGIIDINANVCRNVIFAIKNLKNNKEFCKFFCPALTKQILILISKLEKFDWNSGKYKINKEVFKLYWSLEAAYVFYDKIDINDLKEIILRAKNIPEYTIREKAAKILTLCPADEDFTKARKELKNDENYYVRIF